MKGWLQTMLVLPAAYTIWRRFQVRAGRVPVVAREPEMGTLLTTAEAANHNQVHVGNA